MFLLTDNRSQSSVLQGDYPDQKVMSDGIE